MLGPCADAVDVVSLCDKSLDLWCWTQQMGDIQPNRGVLEHATQSRRGRGVRLEWKAAEPIAGMGAIADGEVLVRGGWCLDSEGPRQPLLVLEIISIRWVMQISVRTVDAGFRMGIGLAKSGVLCEGKVGSMNRCRAARPVLDRPWCALWRGYACRSPRAGVAVREYFLFSR